MFGVSVMGKKKAAVYTRVSTKHEEQLTSLKNQREFYTEYCTNNDFDMVKLYADEGLSATSPNRKEFLEMLNDAGLDVRIKRKRIEFDESDREPKFNWIITKDVTRFSRNTNSIDIARALSEKGVYILFENAGFSTNDNDWELRLNLLLTFSQQESLDRSKKVEFAYKQRAEKGIYHLTQNLYGYKYNKETKKTEIVPHEAENVRTMFDLYINQGYGMKNICNYLNERNILTQNNKQWTPRNIRRLFRNEKYIGTVILNRYTSTGITGSNRKIERPKEEWEIHYKAIPAILDEQTWNKAQEIIAERVDVQKEGSLKGSRKVKNIFYNKLFCGKCGSPFVRVSSTKKRKTGAIVEHNYICRNRRFYHSCDQKMISHNVLERKINNYAKNELYLNLKNKGEAVYKIATNEILLWQAKLKIAGVTRKRIQKEIDEKNSNIQKLISSFLENENSSPSVISVMQEKIEQLKNEVKTLESDLIQHETISIENQINKIKNKQEKITKALQKKDYTFDEAMEYIAKIVIDGKEVKFYTAVQEGLVPHKNPPLDRIPSDPNRIHELADQSINMMEELLEYVKSKK